MTKRGPAWLVIAPLLGLVACADVWGFEDLTRASDAGPRDATTTSDAPGAGPGDGGAVGTDDANEVDDARVGAMDARSGEGGPVVDAGARDAGAKEAGDDGAAERCRASCDMGCCDSTNQCLTTPSASVCGLHGQACVDCADASPSCNPLLQTPCCGATTRQCGCATLTCSAN